jgi:hypothetical protein
MLYSTPLMKSNEERDVAFPYLMIVSVFLLYVGADITHNKDCIAEKATFGLN